MTHPSHPGDEQVSPLPQRHAQGALLHAQCQGWQPEAIVSPAGPACLSLSTVNQSVSGRHCSASMSHLCCSAFASEDFAVHGKTLLAIDGQGIPDGNDEAFDAVAEQVLSARID